MSRLGFRRRGQRGQHWHFVSAAPPLPSHPPLASPPAAGPPGPPGQGQGHSREALHWPGAALPSPFPPTPFWGGGPGLTTPHPFLCNFSFGVFCTEEFLPWSPTRLFHTTVPHHLPGSSSSSRCKPFRDPARSTPLPRQECQT